MEKINWVFDKNDYCLELPFGVAIISEVTDSSEDQKIIGVRSRFKAVFKHHNGSVFTPGEAFVDFDSAEAALKWGVIPEIDLREEDEQILGKLFESLEIAGRYLSGEVQESFQVHYDFIRQLLLGNQPQLAQTLVEVLQREENFEKIHREIRSLNWMQQGDVYAANMNQRELAIKEIRNKNPWVIGRAFGYIPGYENNEKEMVYGLEMVSYEDAEKWLALKMYELKQPDEQAIKLEQLQSTLEACRRFLPEEVSGIHFMRLEWIQARVEEMLS
jgi:hypothetical protein